MLLLAMAAVAVEKSRREALNDAAYVEKTGILEGELGKSAPLICSELGGEQWTE